MTTEISTAMAVNIWEDTVGDSGEAPTDEDLQAFANAVIERQSAVVAMPAVLYNKLMSFLITEGNFSNEPLLLAQDVKNLFGRSARKNVGIVDV